MKLSDTRGHLFSLAIAAGLVACSHAQAKPDALQETKQETKAAEASKPMTPAEQFHAQGQADLDKALEQLHNVSVFFEFDSATLTKDAQEKLTTVAAILTQHPELKVRIEGNADERGSEQYNLALGQRRADSAKKYLDNLGVKHQQITSISFGAEKPKATGHDEEAWKQNRRDDVNAQKDSAQK
jgi:peptidoglycan-associated lipoprotein